MSEWLPLLLILSLLPIWRLPGAEQGVNFWEYAVKMGLERREHVPVEEARRVAFAKYHAAG